MGRCKKYEAKGGQDGAKKRPREHQERPRGPRWSQNDAKMRPRGAKMGPEGGSGATPKVMVEMLLGLWSHPQSDGGDVVGQDGARKGPITRRPKR